MKLHAPVISAAYCLKQTSYLGYHVWHLEEAHLVFVFAPSEAIWYYLSLTPAEYSIFSQFLQYPAEETVPFEVLLPDMRQEVPLKFFLAPLQRHVCRLKKKLPPGWKITCEPGFGYRLRVIKRQGSSTHLSSEPGSGQSCSPSEARNEA
jgi:hypothetical protein